MQIVSYSEFDCDMVECLDEFVDIQVKYARLFPFIYDSPTFFLTIIFVLSATSAKCLQSFLFLLYLYGCFILPKVLNSR